MYLKAFVNWKQNNLVKLLLIAEFDYNHIKNTNTRHTLLNSIIATTPEFFFEKNVHFCSKSYFANKLAKNLKKLIEIYCQNLLHI